MIEHSLEQRLPRTWASLQRGIEDGRQIGAQLYVSLRGQIIASAGIGESRPGVAMDEDTVMLWMSSSKPVAAVATMQLVERGALALDAPVVSYLPDFAEGGKEDVTVFHLLTHTSGFRNVVMGEPEATWEEIIQRLMYAKLEPGWIPGEKAGYHTGSSWYILGELIRQCDGRPFEEYVREEIFLPLGMEDSWIGMPIEQFRRYGHRLGEMHRTDRPNQPPNRWSTELGATRCAPGANGHGPMHNLARFYEMLLGLGKRDGVQILRPETVRQMIARQREGMFDETFKHVIDWGLGLIINSRRYGADTVPYGYGQYASDATFGHSGSQSSVGFADPEHGLVVALVFNGMPGEGPHQQRIRAACDAIYEDLELGQA